MKNLFLLDLDHTLIYGSYAPSEAAEFLFQYSPFLKVYERPFARDLIKTIQTRGDIIVFTTAKKDYAEGICEKLQINPLKILSRSHCEKKGSGFIKKLRKTWSNKYSQILIIDDSPQVWETNNSQVEFIVPKEFRGEKDDKELIKVIQKIENLGK